jgi:hypothetical protein
VKLEVIKTAQQSVLRNRNQAKNAHFGHFSTPAFNPKRAFQDALLPKTSIVEQD